MRILIQLLRGVLALVIGAALPAPQLLSPEYVEAV